MRPGPVARPPHLFVTESHNGRDLCASSCSLLLFGKEEKKKEPARERDPLMAFCHKDTVEECLHILRPFPSKLNSYLLIFLLNQSYTKAG